MGFAEGAFLNHVARETTDVKGLANFYQEVLGFEVADWTPKRETGVIWLKLPSLRLHIIERSANKLSEGPWSVTSAVADTKSISGGHHMCLSVLNFDSFVEKLKEKRIEHHQTTTPNKNIKQVFFFDPDGNGLEVQACEEN